MITPPKNQPTFERRADAVGDRDGEYLSMQRGQYNAWLYVVVGFVFQMALFGLLFGSIAAGLTGLVSNDRHLPEAIMATVALLVGPVAATLVFWNRWKCIEAVSSRYCSGIMNLSLAYVPIVVVVYANYRGVGKLRGR